MQSAESHYQSYYAVLGVHPGASAAEIRAAYHRLAMVSTPYVIGFGLRGEKQSMTLISLLVSCRAEVAPGQDRQWPRGSGARGGSQGQVPEDTRGVPGYVKERRRPILSSTS